MIDSLSIAAHAYSYVLCIYVMNILMYVSRNHIMVFVLFLFKDVDSNALKCMYKNKKL